MGKALLQKDLKKAREIALNNSMEAGDKYKAAHDVKATQHGLQEGDCIFGQSVVFGKEQKICAKMDRSISSYQSTQ